MIVHQHEGKRRVELFHLATDPFDKQNVTESHPDDVQRWSAELARAAARDQDAVVTTSSK